MKKHDALPEDDTPSDTGDGSVDLPLVRPFADLEKRVKQLYLDAGAPSAGRIAAASRGALSKSTAARLLKPWRTLPGRDVFLGLVGALGVPAEDLPGWQRAFAEAKTGQTVDDHHSADDPADSHDVAAPRDEPGRRRRPVRRAVMAAGLALGSAGIASAVVLNLADGRDGAAAPPGPATTPTGSPATPPVGTAIFRPRQRLALPLITDWPIRQRPFDLDRFEQSMTAATWDLSVECRPRGCSAGDRTFTILPLTGTSIGITTEVGTLDDPAPCLRATGRTESVDLQPGRFYCLRTPSRLAAVRLVSVPASSGPLVVTIELTTWAIT